jgi:aryl-alcohol dehydrogenase-like predicted oxidoreductase
MGIGTGGPSNFGQSTGVPEEDVIRMVHRALDLGINFFDTSAAYKESEVILGKALSGVPRENYILATKFQPAPDSRLLSPDEVKESVNRSLERLQVEHIDVMQFHGVDPGDYRRIMDAQMPTVIELKEQGKFNFVGITETYSRDPRHEMFDMALEDDLFDSAMVGYSLISPTAEQKILPDLQKKRVGVICMVAVRRALSKPDILKARIADAKKRGVIAPDSVPDEDPLGWLVKGHVKSLPAAGYKYAAAHPAIGTVLTGTANIAHLEANVEAILGPPLPEEDMARLNEVFGDVWEALGN